MHASYAEPGSLLQLTRKWLVASAIAFQFASTPARATDEIQVYNAGFCKPAVLPSFMEKRVNNAITNRMDALFGWFEKGITEK